MDSERPGESETKPQSPPRAAPPPPPPPPPMAQRYPRPPALLPRMLFLCLKPESWPMAARYPTRFTIVPVILAILIAASIIGIAEGVRFGRTVNGFAAVFTPLELDSKGVLKPKTGSPEPQTFVYSSVQIIVNPSDKASLDPLKDGSAILFTDHDVVFRGTDGPIRRPYESLQRFLGPLPEAGKTLPVDGDFIRSELPAWEVGFAFSRALGQLLGDTLWAVAIMFFLGPLIALVAGFGERRLILPRRAAYRMAAALLVPLILFNALMTALGYSVISVLGESWLIFWFLAASALAVWTALLAKKMYAPIPKRMPRQS